MKLHALLGHPVSENFVSWFQTLKNSSASFLCIQETYNHLHDLAIWKWFKNVYIWSAFVLWSLDNWSRILSGKPFNTFSMAVFRLTLTTPFHCHAYIFISLFHHFFFMICDWGIFFILVTLDLCLLLIHRELWNSQKWQILISVNRDLNFLKFSVIRDQKHRPHPPFFYFFLSFRLWKRCSK
jgi:hypothetical protein